MVMDLWGQVCASAGLASAAMKVRPAIKGIKGIGRKGAVSMPVSNRFSGYGRIIDLFLRLVKCNFCYD
jgi:hypothetical protein